MGLTVQIDEIDDEPDGDEAAGDLYDQLQRRRNDPPTRAQARAGVASSGQVRRRRHGGMRADMSCHRVNFGRFFVATLGVSRCRRYRGSYPKRPRTLKCTRRPKGAQDSAMITEIAQIDVKPGMEA